MELPMNNYEQMNAFENLVQNSTKTHLDASIYFTLIDYYEKEKLFDLAFDAVDRAIADYPLTVEFLLRKAHLYLKLNNPEEALKMLDRAESIAPGNLDIGLHRIWALAELEYFDKALEILEELKIQTSATLPKEHSKINFYEAMVYEQMKESGNMFFALKNALRLDDENYEALEKMFWCVEKGRKHKESRDFHLELLDANPFNFWAWFNLASSYEYLCEYEKAIDAYEFSIALQEDFEVAYRNCAELYFMLKQYDKALKLYQITLEKFEADADLLVQMAKCNLELGLGIAAKKYLDLAIEEGDYNDEAYYYLAKCHEESHNLEEALICYKNALDLDAEKEEYHASIAKIYEQLGDNVNASSHYREAACKGLEFPQYWVDYAVFVKKSEGIHAGMEILEEAMDYTYSESELDYCKIAFLMEGGYKQSAMDLLNETLDRDFHKHQLLFDIYPAIQEDSAVSAALRYFQGCSQRTSVY